MKVAHNVYSQNARNNKYDATKYASKVDFTKIESGVNAGIHHYPAFVKEEITIIQPYLRYYFIIEKFHCNNALCSKVPATSEPTTTVPKSINPPQPIIPNDTAHATTQEKKVDDHQQDKKSQTKSSDSSTQPKTGTKCIISFTFLFSCSQ